MNILIQEMKAYLFVVVRKYILGDKGETESLER